MSLRSKGHDANIHLDIDILGAACFAELWTARDFGPNEDTYVDDMCLFLGRKEVDCPQWLFDVIAQSSEVETLLIAADASAKAKAREAAP